MRTIFSIFLLFISLSLYADDGERCPFIEDDSIIIGWITNPRTTGHSVEKSNAVSTVAGNFRPVAQIAGSKLSETSGAAIKNNQTFWPVFDITRPVKLTNVKSFWDRLGKDHCVYHGTIKDNGLKKFTLLSGRPIKVFRRPTADESALFDKLDTSCERGARSGKNYSPPCKKGLLIAVSDIDKNGSPEYWATEPYTWDTGLTVYEIKNNTMIPVLRVCAGCSD